jgi:Xaa-Pro aminopeptidase
MVVSIETTLKHPRRGFIKLEDTLAVADNGYVIFGESGRGWNRGPKCQQRTFEALPDCSDDRVCRRWTATVVSAV